ncbi:hypothetical protein LIER_29143 [Lithospermum erythrorhizon]|uniref:Reverse transcriptase n=1 Tax=Lithospermum erythrorhizon TaxID=34254 RepID=A0AAV3RN97_LITER
MIKLGFAADFMRFVIDYISTLSYSVLVNEDQYGYFQSSRGLRQGDPLLPYLFIMCTEGLVYLINQAVQEGALKDIKIGR